MTNGLVAGVQYVSFTFQSGFILIDLEIFENVAYLTLHSNLVLF